MKQRLSQSDGQHGRTWANLDTALQRGRRPFVSTPRRRRPSSRRQGPNQGGPSGSGKTTLLSMISGILRPNGGKVVVNGADI